MRVPLRWLSEWIDLPEQDALVQRFTSAGLEVESVLQSGTDFAGLLVGRVLECARHPNADRLSLCTVDAGLAEPLEIICGAPNVEAGRLVALAPVGAELPGGQKIKRSKIRGTFSNGMICSARELGIGDDHEGILLLEGDFAPGTPLAEALADDVGETVLDFEITPNRGDWLSMHGMARELRANFGGALRLPGCTTQEGARPASGDIEVVIEDTAGCSAYLARVVRGVSVAPSPPWLQKRLEAAGLRSINNVVDVTNLVMLEFGQPLHAFDLDKVRGPVCVRAGRPGEAFHALDGSRHTLSAENLVIADKTGAIALAGVIGGAGGEVSAGTVNLLLESAHFAPARVRRSARRCGLATDAGYRYERGVDPDGMARSVDRAARLLVELAGGEVSRGIAEARGQAVLRPGSIALDPARLCRLLGVELSTDQVAELLERVDISVTRDEAGMLNCTPPGYRYDLWLPEDLVEEAARIYGYDNIEPTLPPARLSGTREPRERKSRDDVKQSLVASGLTEVMTVPWIPESDAAALRLSEGDSRRARVRLANPINAELPLLRGELVGSVLRTAARNLKLQNTRLRIFECSRVFRPETPGELPGEPVQAVALLAGTAGPGDAEARFLQAKGVAERLLEDFALAARFRAGAGEGYLHPEISGAFEVEGAAPVVLGEVHPETASAFEVEEAALVVIDVDALGALRGAPAQYREVSRYPAARRDLALWVESGVPVGALLEAIQKKGGAALHSAEFFDRYQPDAAQRGKISLAFHLVFQRLDRTLTDAEVDKAVRRIVQHLEQEFGAELRGGTAANKGEAS